MSKIKLKMELENFTHGRQKNAKKQKLKQWQ
jgi:hypothetical protein